jgi:hypothetical protein
VKEGHQQHDHLRYIEHLLLVVELVSILAQGRVVLAAHSSFSSQASHLNSILLQQETFIQGQLAHLDIAQISLEQLARPPYFLSLLLASAVQQQREQPQLQCSFRTPYHEQHLGYNDCAPLTRQKRPW